MIILKLIRAVIMLPVALFALLVIGEKEAFTEILWPYRNY